MQDKCEHILALAKRKGASQAEVGVSQDTGINVQVRQQDVETVEFNQDNSFGISVYFGQKKGSATSTDTSLEALESAVEAACSIAKYTDEDEYAGLADNELMAQEIFDLDLDHPAPNEVNDYSEFAVRCEAAGLSYSDKVSQSDGASISAHRYARVYGNSHGFSGSISSSRYSLSCVLIAQENGTMQRDYWYSLGRSLDDLESAEHVGKTAADRVVSHLGARTIETQKVPIMMVPEIARGIFGHFLAGIRGGALYRNASCLLDSHGKQIFPDFISLAERPHIKKGLASTCFDNEGVATFDRDIVRHGVVDGYILSSYSARKLALSTTANAGGLHNVIISHSGASFDSLLKQLDTGLLVTEVMGQGVNIVTGDYSRGAAGFWVENGEIQFPVHEITIAGNLLDMFKNIRVVGNDIDTRSSIMCGSVIVDGMTVAGR
jgi:PmbA protein